MFYCIVNICSAVASKSKSKSKASNNSNHSGHCMALGRRYAAPLFSTLGHYMKNYPVWQTQLLLLFVASSFVSMSFCMIFYFASPEFLPSVKDVFRPLAVIPYVVAEAIDGHSPRTFFVCLFMFCQCYVMAGSLWLFLQIFNRRMTL